MNTRTVHILIVSLMLVIVGCGDSPTISIMPKKGAFKQSSSQFNNKLDILLVIDNSGSMSDNQAKVASGFTSFMQNFSTKGYDFKIAVTTTEAYLAGKETFKGTPKVLVPSTPNLAATFGSNVSVGTNGSGAEKAFASFKASLDHSSNAGFLRGDSFLAVIIVSDEDDGSAQNATYYRDYLNTKTGTSGATARYNVSAITGLDTLCAAVPYAGTKYRQLVALTGGVEGDICNANFNSALDGIQAKIAELSTRFILESTPDLTQPFTVSISYGCDDTYVTVPKSDTSGWSYDAAPNALVFHGSYVPPQNSCIGVDYTPVGASY